MNFSANKAALKIAGLQLGLSLLVGALYYFAKSRLGMSPTASSLPAVLGVLLGAMAYALAREQKFPGELAAYTHQICRRVAALQLAAQIFFAGLIAEGYGKLPHSLRGFRRLLHSKRALAFLAIAIVISIGLSYLGTWSGLRSGIKSARRAASKR